ncbi:MAG TPA: hypothetical protein VH681_11340, partial [Nitrospiraceae bacterium]
MLTIGDPIAILAVDDRDHRVDALDGSFVFKKLFLGQPAIMHIDNDSDVTRKAAVLVESWHAD